jgi:hypothetical protein
MYTFAELQSAAVKRFELTSDGIQVSKRVAFYRRQRDCGDTVVEICRMQFRRIANFNQALNTTNRIKGHIYRVFCRRAAEAVAETLHGDLEVSIFSPCTACLGVKNRKRNSITIRARLLG